MKLRKIAALITSSCMVASITVPVYASGDYDEIEMLEDIDEEDYDDIEIEQSKDEDFDEEYGLEDSDIDGDPFLDDQDSEEGKKHCCNCGCCVENPEPEDNGFIICDDCKIIMTKEEMERNAKELASIMPDWESLKKDSRFYEVFPKTREEMENGDIMMMADAMYIYVWLSDEIYTWYEVTPNGIEETPNLRFSTYAKFYRYQKANPAYTVPDYLIAFQGNQLSSTKLPVGWTWQKPDKMMEELGDTMCYATYTPANRLLYNTIYNIEVNVKVVKAQLGVSYPEERYILSYRPDFTLSMLPLPEGWRFEEADTVPDIGSKYYIAVFDADDNYDYTSSIEAIKIRIDVKKSIVAVDDMHIKAYAGTILKDSMLPKMNGGHLEWDVAQRVVTKDAVYTCHFVPDDLKRYYITKNISVYVTVTDSSTDEEVPEPELEPQPVQKPEDKEEVKDSKEDVKSEETESKDSVSEKDTGKNEDDTYTIILPANNGSVAPPDKTIYEIELPVQNEEETKEIDEVEDVIANLISGNADASGKYHEYNFKNATKDSYYVIKQTSPVIETENAYERSMQIVEDTRYEDYNDNGDAGYERSYYVISWDEEDDSYYEQEIPEQEEFQEIGWNTRNYYDYYNEYTSGYDEVVLEDYENEEEDVILYDDFGENDGMDEIIVTESSEQGYQNSVQTQISQQNTVTTSNTTVPASRQTSTSSTVKTTTPSRTSTTTTTSSSSSKSSFTVSTGSSSSSSKNSGSSTTVKTVAQQKAESRKEEEEKKKNETPAENLTAGFNNDDEEDPTVVINTTAENTGKNTALSISGPIGNNTDNEDDTHSNTASSLVGLTGIPVTTNNDADKADEGGEIEITSSSDDLTLDEDPEEEDMEDTSDIGSEDEKDTEEDKKEENPDEKKKYPVKTTITVIILFLVLGGCGFAVFKLLKK